MNTKHNLTCPRAPGLRRHLLYRAGPSTPTFTSTQQPADCQLPKSSSSWDLLEKNQKKMLVGSLKSLGGIYLFHREKNTHWFIDRTDSRLTGGKEIISCSLLRKTLVSPALSITESVIHPFSKPLSRFKVTRHWILSQYALAGNLSERLAHKDRHTGSHIHTNRRSKVASSLNLHVSESRKNMPALHRKVPAGQTKRQNRPSNQSFLPLYRKQQIFPKISRWPHTPRKPSETKWKEIMSL